jgi:hypothetical protein
MTGIIYFDHFLNNPDDLSLKLLRQTIYDCNNGKKINIGEYDICFLESKPKVALLERMCN